MFLFGRNGAQGARLRALRALYRSFNEQNGPEARARPLLRNWLSPEQRAQFDANGFFEVTGSHTSRRYRIHQGTTTMFWSWMKNWSLRRGGASFPNGPWQLAM